MSLFKKIKNKKEKIAVVGLGYVGLPLAISFANKVDVIGFDIDKEKINLYQSGIDPTEEVGNDAISESTIQFTANEIDLQQAMFHVISVPTPINMDKTPNFTPLNKASEMVGRNLKKGSIIVYESTVYPGVTEDICIPILERESGLVCGVDFKVGYSPERINPGDKVNTLEKIVKIVSGIDEASLNEIANIYELIIDAGVHKAGSIKVAEAAKVVENSQRDINIAFMNELAIVFDRMNIDTEEVIAAMKTKWNALNFHPGLVGGHCIGVDPYYFIYEAERLGYHSQIILTGRKINDGMAKFVSNAIIKQLIQTNKVVRQANVTILGLTFKENCPDIRNSKVIDIIDELNEYSITPTVVDPRADKAHTEKEHGISLVPLEQIKDADCLVFAVAHDEFKQLDWEQIDEMFRQMPNDEKVIIDVRGILDKKEVEERQYRLWRL